MQRSKLMVALLLAVANAGPAAAVEMSRTGQGQVLLFPYYTVNDGNSTLISLVNHTDEVKALKVRFREAMNGRSVLDFNLYLPPHGNWRAALMADGEQGPARLVADTLICSAPDIPSSPVPFRNFAYTGSMDDDGPNSLDRTREGFVEVIEMGVVVNDGDVAGLLHPLPDAATNRSGVDNEPGDGNLQFATEATQPADDVAAKCQGLVDAWTTGGAWNLKPTKDIDEPAGGLSGIATIVDVAKGVSYNQAADAIDGFFTVANSGALHTAPGAVGPTLSDARTRAQGPVDAWFAGGELLRWKPATPGAVSAVLMRDTLANRFETSDAMMAASEWVVTFPTKQLHLAASDAGARLPFVAMFGKGCEPLPLEVLGDGGHDAVADDDTELCFQSNIVGFNQAASIDAGHSAVFGSRQVASNIDAKIPMSGTEFPYAHVEAALGDADNVLDSEPDAVTGKRTRLRGLPVIGFWAARFVNTNAQPGLLASYAVSAPHTGSVHRETLP